MRSGLFGIALLTCTLLVQSAMADVRFVTWNVDGVQKSLSALKSNAAGMNSDVGPVDVLILQEVISADQVAAIAEELGLGYWAISDLAPPVSITGSGFKSLEMAVVSRFPLVRVAEWDTTGQLSSGDGYLPRTSQQNITTEELNLNVPLGANTPSRGFLRVDIEGGWTIYAVHWKSSRGESCNELDVGFARKREKQAEGVLADATSAIAQNRTVVVAGDFNVQAPGNVLRSGTDLSEDCRPTSGCRNICGAGGSDGYDDSIHTLLQIDPNVTLLSKETDFTYVKSPFPGGAIDHILVAGPQASGFAAASTPPVSGGSYRGSDHRPVVAVNSNEVTNGRTTDRERLNRLIGEVRARLLEIESIADRIGD